MPESPDRRKEEVLRRIASSRAETVGDIGNTRDRVQQLLPQVQAPVHAARLLAAVGVGLVMAGVAVRAVRKSRKAAAVGAAAAVAVRGTSPWPGLLAQVCTSVLVPALRTYLMHRLAGASAPQQEVGCAPHAAAPQGSNPPGSLFALPKLDLNPARAFYRWLGLEK